MNPDLLILCATPLEVSHFLVLCPEHSSHVTKAGHKFFSGKIGTHFYDLLITGPGVFNAVSAFTNYLNQFVPGMVVATGIAGVFKQAGFHIGDIGLATHDHYIHTGIQTENIKNDPLPFDLIEQHPLTRQGLYPFDKEKVENYQKKISQKYSGEDSMNIFKGPFITVSTITSSLDYADQLYLEFGAVMEAMEGAACAHVAACHDLPIIEIRAASNFVGERDKSKWDMDVAVKNLGQVLSLI